LTGALEITVPPPPPGSSAGYKYGSQSSKYQPNPVGPQIPDLAASQQQTYNPYSAFSQGLTAGQLALMIDTQLNHSKAPGTYQSRRVVGYEFDPVHGQVPIYGPYINVPVSGQNPLNPYYQGAYLSWDSISRTKTIGGGEGYPDLAPSWNEWAMKQPPFPAQGQAAGGGGYGGGYGGYGGGYPPYEYPQYPAQIQPAPGVQVDPARRQSRPGYFGGGGYGAQPMFLPGSGGARARGIASLVSWSL